MNVVSGGVSGGLMSMNFSSDLDCRCCGDCIVLFVHLRLVAETELEYFLFLERFETKKTPSKSGRAVFRTVFKQ